jgi:hypothetical protein
MQSSPFAAHVADPYRQAILTSCQRAHTSAEFSWEFVAELAHCSDSAFCLWLNKRGATLELFSASADAACLLDVARCMCDEIPRVDNFVRGIPEIQSIAIAPVRFRTQMAGVLVLANRSSGYSEADIRALELIGSAAVVHFEWLRCAEMFGAPLPQPASVTPLRELVHEMRQPLGAIEASAYLVGLMLPEEEHPIRAELERMRKQVEIASDILTDATPSRRASRSGDSAQRRPEAAGSVRAPEPQYLTNSATASVT